MKRAPFYFLIPDDEVPYSTVARYALIGAFRAPLALNQIYGNRKKRINPYLPGFINKFADFFELSPDEVIATKTIYPLLKYSQPSDTSIIKMVMKECSDDKVLLKTAMGHSRFATFYGLKFCSQCTQEDIHNHGFPYWHIRHQIPGIEVCFNHGCLLEKVAMGNGNRDRALFLPSFTPIATTPGTPIQCTLASFSTQLFELSIKNKLDYSTAYHHLLEERELISCNGGYVFISQVIEQLSQYWQTLNFCEHGEIGVPLILKDFKFIGRILRHKTHSHAHPLKHILLACWLTNNDATRLLPFRQPKAKASLPISDCSDTDELILTLLLEGNSINSTYEKVGRSRCYIRHVAELNMVSHPTNAQAFSTEVNRAVIRKALYGIHRKEIAKSVGVGIGYVEQVICNEPRMTAWRKHMRIQDNVHNAYEKLIELRKEHPDWNRTKLREAEQAAYFMLYNHDKSLIERTLPQPLKPAPYKKNWKAEDERLCLAVLRLKAVDIVSITSIGRKINDHGYLRTAIDKLPKTHELLKKLGKLE
ncbi:MAG: TnsD family transposase [Colwellia sp.]|nr:TnsD family transposase [Colwellia sp.]